MMHSHSGTRHSDPQTLRMCSESPQAGMLKASSITVRAGAYPVSSSQLDDRVCKAHRWKAVRVLENLRCWRSWKLSRNEMPSELPASWQSRRTGQLQEQTEMSTLISQ